ncbi:bifunctional sugar-1-phosphate nucleotidylyltransferase/acetyltransferase [Methanoregula sp.]|uniref:bifunctional sugar-1-phosphate nucleotidylyltransferase/acetyltransferase n=1 Tax=Methanoregula sp. TaxID=2052170 RepID=UPI002C6D1F5B|nr:bifunctional sugar-1-phosphate nucleotidylyltransferase/acetyltransferase [Methanoregula sp.]HVP96566.1 bifunctional sugar-1-phosphate nucleotidylyltransferase/acetyltransferase [Methanoregula sp.]
MECIVLAAGEGKRMRPLTARRPKVMLPVANRPMMEHLVLAARDAGIRDFVFVVGYGEREVRSHFGDGSRFGIHVRYAPQRQQAGTADALRSAQDLVSCPFLALNGDMILSSADIIHMMKTPAPCMGTSTTDHPWDFGVVLVENDRVTSLEEKSKRPKSNTINAGAYHFTPDIFDLLAGVSLSSRGELELTDALGIIIGSKRLGAVPLSTWLDIGYPWDLLDANAALLSGVSSENKGTIEEGVHVSGPVLIGQGTVVKSGTYIEGPCIIGNNCRIGPHVFIRGATSIGDECHIGHCTEIKNSVIMARTKIPHFNYVGDSVIGSGCNFGAGTKIANLRHDHAPVKSGGKDTRRTKFGAVIGDNVSFGINCSVNVGSVVGSNAHFAPNSVIEGSFGENSTIR